MSPHPLLAVSFLVLLLQPALANGDPPPTVTYFLHQAGECTSPGARFADQNDTSGDASGCGVTSPAVEFTLDYPGRTPLANVSLDSASTANASLFLDTANPSIVSIELRVTAGTASCHGTSANRTNPSTPLTGDYREFNVRCTFNGLAAASTVPSFSIVIHSQGSYAISHEGESASRIEIAGVPATANATVSPSPSPANGTSADTPGFSLAATTMIVVGIAILVAPRRRG